MTEVCRRSRFYSPFKELISTGTLNGFDPEAEWVWTDRERFPANLTEDEFLDALDDLAAGRFLS